MRHDAYDDYAYDDRQRYCVRSNGANGVESVHVMVQTGGKFSEGQLSLKCSKKTTMA